MRVTTEGLEELNSYEPSPEVYWNDNVGAWDDQLGHFSYDGGATWGAARSYAAAPAPVSTAGAMESLGNTYSLSGPAFDDFNIGTLTPEPDIPVWDEATQGYRDKWGNFSYDGGVTWGAPRYYAPPPVSTAGALAQLPEGPTDRASFIDYEGANAGNPFDAPGFESPWMPPAMQDDGDGGGLWGGFKNALGNIAEVGTVPYQLANEVADRLTGSTEQERWESNVSGNQFADLVTGGRADLEDLPYGLGYATDAALAPATWLTAGVGPSVPVLGSTFSGNVGKRLAGEIVVGAAGIKGSELGAEYAPEVIPNFSVPNIDAEILGRDVLLGDEALNFLGSDAGQSVAGGILGGLAGGVGAYGGLKGLDAALNLGAVDETIPSIYKASPFRVGDEAQFPAFARDLTVPPGRAIPQVAGAADDALPPKPPVASADTALNEPRRKLLDALDEQRRFRESGQADEIIHAGRVQQAKGIAAATGNLGDTFAESLDSMRAGASVGKMLPAGQSLGLDDDTTLSLLKEAIEFNGGKQFDNYRAAKALSKLQNGEKLQPGEIKMLGQIYGDEVARAIRETNAGRIATVAELTPDDIVKINEQARVDGKRAAVLEAQARRQHELADELQEQLRMDPTNKRLAKAVDDARARAIAKENEADRVLAERANALAAKQEKSAQKAAQSAARAENKADVATQLREDRAAVLNDVRQNGQEALAKAQAIIDESEVSPALKAQQHKALEAQLKIDEAVLGGMGTDAPGVIRQMYAASVGEVTDSFTSKLLMEQAFFKTAMEQSGMSTENARRMAKLLQEIELKQRFGGNIPSHVQDSLNMAKSQRGMDAAVARGAGDISQTLKNTTLGIGDAAVFGQQGAKLTLTDTPQILAGAVNRLLNKAHAGIDTGFQVNNLPRRAQKALDGVSLSSQGITDLSQEGTIFSLIPKVGKRIDYPMVKITEFLTDLQFKHVLGSLRDLSFEGNLVLAKLAGDDVTNPIVRQTAADWANVSSGAAKLAQRSTRREVEKAAFLSPGLTRAQIQKPGQIVRGLRLFAQDATWVATLGKVSRNLDAGTRFERLAAATSIASIAAVSLAMGKVLNDYVGLEPFEFDPSKPTFGNITLPGGTVANVFPQEQVAKTVARSFRILAEDGVTQSDVASLMTEWGKLAIGRSSPAARIGLGYLDTGYQPGEGYKFGDMDMGWKDNLASALTPPIAQSISREGWDNLRTPLEFLGVNAYPESQYDAIDRQVKNDPAFGGRGYSDLSPLEKQAAQEKYGKLEPFGPEGERAAEVLSQKIQQQTASDDMRTRGVIDPEQWRRDYQTRKDELRITNDEIYASLRASGKLQTKDPILKPYYAAMAAAEGADGNLDWDKVDAYLAGLTPAESDYISKNTGLIKIDTPAVRQFEAVRDKIDASGYFDRSEQNWRDVAYYVPQWDEGLGKPINPSDYDSYEDWRAAALQAGLALVGATREDIGTVTQINAWLDKQEPAKGMEWYGKEWKDQWVIANPQTAYEAWRYGYYNPRKEIKEWLMEQYE